MLQNLNYIYKAMYVLDMWDRINNILNTYILGLPIIIFILWALVYFSALLVSDDVEDVGKCWKYTKWWHVGSIVLWIIAFTIYTIMPSKNTVKAYIGVKAVQAVGEYIDKETDIPERSKATITKLWNKVDSYIETIDTEDIVKEKIDGAVGEIDSSKDNVDSIVKNVKSKVGEEQVNKLVEATRKQVVDSLIAIMKK